MPLTDVAVRSAKPRERDYKLADGGGLYLLVRPNGSRLWNMAFRYGGRQKKLSIGPYPAVSLQAARERRQLAKALLASGADPALAKRAEKSAAVAAAATTLRLVAAEWIEKLRREGISEDTIGKIEWQLSFALVEIGQRPVAEVSAPEFLTVLRKLELSGRCDTARRLRSVLGRIMRYAIATGRATRDPAADLVGAISSPKVTHYAAIVDPVKVGALMRAIHGYDGSYVTREALRVVALTFVRSAELRGALWSEIDGAEWRIPAARMKMGRDHVVPLSRQALAAIERVRAAGARGPYVFPSQRSAERPMSENTINAALRTLGYAKTEMTGHGFRTMASTLLNEQGWNSDWIERQLAHVETNKIRGAYNAAEWLTDRRRMMQSWADYLGDLAADDDFIG